MTLMMICQFVVIQAKLMQDRCMQVVYGCYFFDAAISDFICPLILSPPASRVVQAFRLWALPDPFCEIGR